FGDCHRLHLARTHAARALAHHGGAGGHGFVAGVRAQQPRPRGRNPGAPEPHVRRRLHCTGHRDYSANLHPMTRRRWIADEYSRDRAALVGEHAAHLSRTLRARVGQQFEVACGDALRQGTITSVTDDCVEFALGEELPAGQTVPITLLLAVFKFDRMEWAIEKCTELNVTTIVPVVARRSETRRALAPHRPRSVGTIPPPSPARHRRAAEAERSCCQYPQRGCTHNK